MHESHDEERIFYSTKAAGRAHVQQAMASCNVATLSCTTENEVNLANYTESQNEIKYSRQEKIIV